MKKYLLATGPVTGTTDTDLLKMVPSKYFRMLNLDFENFFQELISSLLSTHYRTFLFFWPIQFDQSL